MKYKNKKYTLIICLMWLANLLAIGNIAYAQAENKTYTPVEILMAEPELADSSVSSSLFVQAKKYHDGDGVKQDFLRAHSLYLKAAGMGNNDARVNLGYLYFMGEGVQQSYPKARNWYLSAANNGSKDAQLNLAMIYQNGFGVTKDNQKAEYWLTYKHVKPEMKKAVVRPVVQPPITTAKVKKTAVAKPIIEQTKVRKAKISKPEPSLAQEAKVLPSQTKRIIPKTQPLIPQVAISKPEVSEDKPVIVETQVNNAPQVKQVTLHAQLLTPSAQSPSAQFPSSQSNLTEADASIPAIKQDNVLTSPFKKLRNLPLHSKNNPESLSLWFSMILAILMLVLVFVTSFWFFIQYSTLAKQRKAHVFARAFYAHHRDRLRVNYLRYSVKHRKIDTMDSSWATALCVLMVRFAQSQEGEDTLVGMQSHKILQALQESPFKAKQAVFPFVKVTQHRIFDDIQAHEHNYKGTTEYDEAPQVVEGKDVGQVVKIKEVLILEKGEKVTPVAKIKEVMRVDTAKEISGSNSAKEVKPRTVCIKKQEILDKEDFPPNSTK